MKIAFITGSLEPGRDGVGDYTIGLAAELQLQGHDVIIIAIRDKFVGETVSTDQQGARSGLHSLRIPARLSWLECVWRAGQQLDEFNPEWVSLQFVCYSFHPKGLVYELAGKLAPLLKGRKLHIMFHEVWLCKELGWGWTQSAVGALQRFFIQRFISAARPDVVHTSNATYSALLNRSGIPAAILELFGNVPVLSKPGTAWIESQLRKALGDEYHRDDVLLFGFFGALHPQWPPEPLLTHLYRAAQVAGKKPILLSIGRTGSAGLELWRRITNEYADRFSFLRLDEQPVERISEYLSFLDYGIATTPRSIIGKSGTVISMLEHGLPVIVNRNDAPGAATELTCSEQFLFPYADQLNKLFASSIPKGPQASRRPKIVTQLIQDLCLDISGPRLF